MRLVGVPDGKMFHARIECEVWGEENTFRTSDVGRIHIGAIIKSRDKLNESGIRGLRKFVKGTILLPKSGASTFRQ